MNREFTVEERTALRRQLTGELTEALVYARLAALEKSAKNRDTLARIGTEEQTHAGILSGMLGEPGAPNRGRAGRIVLSARVFGLTFALKFMENGEAKAGPVYRALAACDPRLRQIAADEDSHEQALIDLLADERLAYMGTVVYGLNDALVELTGSIAGFTFALREPRIIAMTGLILGSAAGMSMAATSYLAAKTETGPQRRSPLKSAAYTGAAYFAVVVALVFPYLVSPNVGLSLACMLGMAVAIIALFSFYSSVAKGTSFRSGFLEMLSISGGVAAISFGIGYVLNRAFGV